MDDLFFIASKLFWNLFNPAQLLLALLAVGVALSLTRWYRIGFRMVLFSGLIIFLVSLFPVGQWMIASLEQRFASSELPSDIEGIILLGGASKIDQETGEVQAMDSPGDGDGDSDGGNHGDMPGAQRRYAEGLILMRHYPDVPVIFTGFSNRLFPDDLSEADVAQRFFDEAGENRRVIYERRARNTYENALYSKDFAKERLHRPWLLITSAVHMPRSVGVFRKAGWNVIPAPVDYIVEEDFRSSQQWSQWSLGLRLNEVNTGIRHWLGLIVYYLTGRTDSFIPG